MTRTHKYRIATIPGDGIGREVIPVGQRVVGAVGKRHGFSIVWDAFDWSCERYAETGRMMPGDGIAQVKEHDAIYLGAVGFPEVPDHISLWGLLIPLRRELDQYASVRPVRLLRGDVVVVSNLFGDILSDLGPAVAGSIGIAPSANINPDRTYPSMFEPVRGSAPSG
jgi:isocitrate/isopropylmalate dehydrogenase